MRFALIAIAGLCAAIAAGQTNTPATRPTASSSRPYPLGKDTTRIESPLLPDGRPDYLAALNQMASKGVTKDNNAAVVLVRALDPKIFLPGSDREKILAAMGTTLPAERAYYDSPKGEVEKAHDKCLFMPWKAKDYPALAAWLEESKPVLAFVSEAASRPRLYMPFLKQEKDTFLTASSIPNYGGFRGVAKALVVRSNLALGEGRPDDAVADLLTVHRLGCLLGQDITLLGRLVGISITALAENAIAADAALGAFTPAQALKIAKELTSAKTPDTVAVFDTGERFAMLEAITWASMQTPEKAVEGYREVQGLPPTENPPDLVVDEALREAWKRIDWNALLRMVNSRYDQIVVDANLPSFAKRVGALQKDGQAFSEMVKNLPSRPVKLDQSTEWLGQVIFTLYSPMVGRQQVLADLATVRRDLAVVALGLCAFKADNGKYPDKLDELAPKYLGKVPEDFCSGKPFVYKKTAGGYILYSVGENMKDEGGKDKSEGGDDIVVKTPPAPASRPK